MGRQVTPSNSNEVYSEVTVRFDDCPYGPRGCPKAPVLGQPGWIKRLVGEIVPDAVQRLRYRLQ